jgi:hypothetical protein
MLSGMEAEHRGRSVTFVLTLALAAQLVVITLVDADLAFAIILGFVAVKLPRDRAWLVVPIIINGYAFLDVVARTLTQPPGQGPAIIEPFFTYGVFLIVYAAGYLMLHDPPATRKHPVVNRRPDRNQGWRFDRWAG